VSVLSVSRRDIDASRVYIGKANRCCCGCSGVYYEDDSKAAQRARARVYKALTTPDASIMAAPSFLSAEIGGRVFTVYWNARMEGR
jgi:hypothetical protein